jgi:hypothetical protein
MQERRGRGHAREVIAGGERETDVADRHGGGRPVQPDRRPIYRGDHVEGHDQRRDEDDDGRRQKPPCAASVELDEADPARSLVLAEEQARDQEATDDEEDVDPDEAADQARQAGVEQDDDQDGKAADAFDVGSKARLGSGVSRSAHGHVSQGMGRF